MGGPAKPRHSEVQTCIFRRSNRQPPPSSIQVSTDQRLAIPPEDSVHVSVRQGRGILTSRSHRHLFPPPAATPRQSAAQKPISSYF